jgi:hypothetical protein
MSTGAIILIVLVTAILIVVPVWPYSKGWGYAPCGSLGVALAFIVAMVMLGKL